MAIARGAGTEIIRSAQFEYEAANTTATNLLIGVQHHIYTIISIIFCDNQAAAGTLGIRMNDGSNDIAIVDAHAHAAYATFIFSDKFVLEEDDDLEVYNSGTHGDWIISYIDQDWT